MSLIQMISQSLKETLLSFSSDRSYQEAIIKYDFKIDLSRQNLMQLCFSQLAEWPLYLILLFIYFDPSKYSWSLQKTLGPESSLSSYLLDGRVGIMLIAFVLFFFVEWISKKSYILISLLFYFLAKSDIHVHLALAGLLAVFFAKSGYLLWLTHSLNSRTKNIWLQAMILHMTSFFITVIASLASLQFLQTNSFFSESFSVNRFQFLLTVLLFFHVMTFFLQSVWGHFSLNRKIDPSDLPIYYSTSIWMKRFKMKKNLKNRLRNKTREVLKSHLVLKDEMDQIKAQGLAIQFNLMSSALHQEIAYLQNASSRLTVD